LAYFDTYLGVEYIDPRIDRQAKPGDNYKLSTGNRRNSRFCATGCLGAFFIPDHPTSEDSMQLVSSAFQAGAAIPSLFTCDGEDISPELSWRDAPVKTEFFVLTMRDPDAPKVGGFTHWVVYNIPGSVGHIEQNVPKQATVPGLGLQGKNDSGKVGYMGPAPPSGTHRYFARLFALNSELNLPPGASHEQVRQAMEGHILDRAELMGTYTRKAGRAA
jgi:Raf kinase inhibitor-like YbhB/YbcL family protein